MLPTLRATAACTSDKTCAGSQHRICGIECRPGSRRFPPLPGQGPSRSSQPHGKPQGSQSCGPPGQWLLLPAHLRAPPLSDSANSRRPLTFLPRNLVCSGWAGLKNVPLPPRDTKPLFLSLGISRCWAFGVWSFDFPEQWNAQPPPRLTQRGVSAEVHMLTG